MWADLWGVKGARGADEDTISEIWECIKHIKNLECKLRYSDFGMYYLFSKKNFLDAALFSMKLVSACFSYTSNKIKTSFCSRSNEEFFRKFWILLVKFWIFQGWPINIYSFLGIYCNSSERVLITYLLSVLVILGDFILSSAVGPSWEF